MADIRGEPGPIMSGSIVPVQSQSQWNRDNAAVSGPGVTSGGAHVEVRF
jgi:hypothetical protein